MIRDRAAKVVAIDGCNGVGKTTLGNRLANYLSGAQIDFDAFLERHSGEFLAALQLDKLRSELDRKRASSPVIVLSGVCMLSVLSKLSVTADLLIYVVMRSVIGNEQNWDVMRCEENGVEALAKIPSGVLQHEIGKYHMDFRPRGNADVVYIHIEQSPPIE